MTDTITSPSWAGPHVAVLWASHHIKITICFFRLRQLVKLHQEKDNTINGFSDTLLAGVVNAGNCSWKVSTAFMEILSCSFMDCYNFICMYQLTGIYLNTEKSELKMKYIIELVSNSSYKELVKGTMKHQWWDTVLSHWKE